MATEQNTATDTNGDGADAHVGNAERIELLARATWQLEAILPEAQRLADASEDDLLIALLGRVRQLNEAMMAVCFPDDTKVSLADFSAASLVVRGVPSGTAVAAG